MSKKTKVVQLPPGGEGSHQEGSYREGPTMFDDTTSGLFKLSEATRESNEALATATGELNNGLFEIADAIRELSKEYAKSRGLACFNCGMNRYVNPNGLCNKCQMIKDRKIEKKNKGK